MTNETAPATTPADAIRAACEALGLTMRSEFVPFSKSRSAGADQPSLNWRVTLERNGRDILTTDYGAGCAHAPSYSAKMPRAYPGSEKQWRRDAIAYECENGFPAVATIGGGFRAMRDKPIRPEAADVVYSLVMDSGVLDYPSFEGWAAEYGYDADSRKAEATWRACLDIALQLRAAIGDAGIEALRTASEGY